MTDRNVYSGTFNMDNSQSAFNSGTQANLHYTMADPGAEQLLQLIKELRQKVTEHAQNLPDADGMHASVDMLQEQIQNGTPKPGRLRALAASMAAMAGNVGAISAAVTAIRNAIG